MKHDILILIIYYLLYYKYSRVAV